MERILPLHPQVIEAQRVVDSLGLPQTHELTPGVARKNSGLVRAALPLDKEPVGDVKETSITGPAGRIPIRIYSPEGDGPHPLVMVFHGGGWVVGDLETEDTTCRGLCRRLGAVVVSVDYRLAPETRYPGAVEDCLAATNWAVSNAAGIDADPGRLALAGTSAGGNLTGAVSLMARDTNGPKIAHQVLFCPVIDADFDRPSYIANATDYGLTRESMMWFWDHYTGDGDARFEPYASIIRAEEHTGLPDATVIAAEYDPLLDEAVAYAGVLRAAGVDTSCTVYNGMTHGFNIRVGVLDAAANALDEAADRISASFSRV